MNAAAEVGAQVGIVAATRALGVSRATVQRRRAPPPPRTPTPRPAPTTRLSEVEVERVFEQLHAPRFVDASPDAIVATLLDEGTYLASPRTFYRLLASRGEARERRNQLRHEKHAVPRLVADAPNRVWSWDVAKLRGPSKGVQYHLYVVFDIFSRYVVGWTVADCESAAIAGELFAETCRRQGTMPGQLVVHADRGAPMRSLSLAELLGELGVARSFSRPRVSDDNPFSEACFKTVKYHPTFPGSFASLGHAIAFMRELFDWYNHRHRHSGIAWLAPADVHFGRAKQVVERRIAVLERARKKTPGRFARNRLRNFALPDVVCINPPDNLVRVDSRQGSKDPREAVSRNPTPSAPDGPAGPVGPAGAGLAGARAGKSNCRLPFQPVAP